MAGRLCVIISVNKKYDKISFQKVKERIEQILNYSTKNEWDLLPDHIYELAESCGIKIKKTPVKNWEEFEYGNKEFDDVYFLKYLLPSELTKGQVIIVTDECFKSRNAYQVAIGNLAEFISVDYPEIHKMELFQPADLIIVSQEYDFISILHHGGFVFQLTGTA